MGIILRSSNPAALEAGLKILEGQRPLIHAATPANAEAMAALALKYNAPLVARAATLDELVPIVYADTPVRLHRAARRSLYAHLLKLKQDGRARCNDDEWRLV